MAKVKITKKELPFLKRDMDIDDAVLKKLNTVQVEYKTRFKERIEVTKKKALERYTSKIDSLTTAKSQMLREYNEEIKKYEALVKDIKKTTK